MRIEGSSSTAMVLSNPINEQAVPIKQQGQQKESASTEQKEAVPFLQEQIKEERGPEIAEEQVITAIEKANHKFQFYNTHLEFSIHEKTKEIMVKVYRDEEVIREIPPEKVLDMVAHMLESAGLLVDETV